MLEESNTTSLICASSTKEYLDTVGGDLEKVELSVALHFYEAEIESRLHRRWGTRHVSIANSKGVYRHAIIQARCSVAQLQGPWLVCTS